MFSKQSSDLTPNSIYIKNRQKEIRGFPKRSTKIDAEMSDEAIKMIKMMGLPIIEAPENAEAQCAELVKSGKCYAAISEDTDALAFGCTTVIRGIKNRNDPVIEIRLDEVLRELDITFGEFVDLCILLGTKRCKNIQMMGPISAYKHIQQCSNIENILEKVVKGHKKYVLPKMYDFQSERDSFLDPTVLDTRNVEFSWKLPDEDNLKQFLIAVKGFAAARVETGLKSICTKYGKPTQLKIESFFINPIKRPPAPIKKKIKKRGNPFFHRSSQ